MNATRDEIIGDKVEFLSHHTKITFMFSANHASLADAELRDKLLHPNPEAPFF